MASQIENCENCAFGQDEFRHFHHHCRRHSPIAITGKYGYETVWPRVSAVDFCGDFEQKDAE